MIDLKERGRKGGLIGGRSKSKAKAAASRKNGNHEKAGRERTRTLGEMLLRRKLNAKEHDVIREGFFKLSPEERVMFKKFFFGHKLSWPENQIGGYFDLNIKEKDKFSFPTNPSEKMRHILRKFRLEARWRLSR
jgi:hypothetical protein